MGAPTRLESTPADDFWAITVYFNLTNGERRRRNYHCFRRHLAIPLLTVEWNPTGNFHLDASDADKLFQIAGGDLMWQKERLLTIAAAALPAHVKYVAWLDCDVLVEDTNWADKARDLLQKKSLVQLFREAVYPDARNSERMVEMAAADIGRESFDCASSRESFLSLFERVKAGIVDLDISLRFEREVAGSVNIMKRPSHGLAWAAPISFFRDLGLYDRCIVGAGDLFFSYAITGLTSQLLANQRFGGWAFYGENPSFGIWSRRAAEIPHDRLGYLDGRVVHLFHGDMAERQYASRIAGIVPFALDLDRDIAAPANGPWSWERDRYALNAYFLRYLYDRNEDRPLAPEGVTSPPGGFSSSR